MSMPRRGRFETIIQGLLDNVQRGNENIQRRFEVGEERDFVREREEDAQDFTRERDRAAEAFTREQYNVTRTDYLADQETARTNQLTDMAFQLNQKSLEGLRTVLPFLIGTPDFDDAQALIAELSRPHGLTGQAALDRISNLTINIAGRQVNLAGSLAKWQADADVRYRSEEMGTTLLADWLPKVGDGSLKDEVRDSYLNAILGSSLIDDTFKLQAIDARGITDPEARAAVERSIRRDEAATDVAELERDILRIDADMYQLFKDGDLDAMNDAARARGEMMGLTDLQNFWETGYLPEDNDALVRLARQVAGGNMTLLRSMSSANQNRYGKGFEMRARAEALGVDAQELDLKVAEWSFDRTVEQADLTDAMAIATQVSAAALTGDVPFLTMMKGLQDSGAYGDILGHLDIDAWIANAQDIHQTGEATRAAARAAATIERRTGVEEYISSIGSSFVLDGLEMGLDGEWIGLDELIDAELMNISGQDLLYFGVTEDDLRNKLKSWAVRALNQNNLSEVQQRLAALEAAIPPEGDAMRREAWRASYIDGMQLLGFSEAEADAIASRLLTDTDQRDAKWEAENTRIWQEIDLTYQQAVGQEIQNMRDLEVLNMMLEGEGASMTIEQFQKLQSMYGEIAQRAQDMVNSGACGIPTSEAMWVAGTEVPQTFQPELPGCQQALNDANNARAMMNQLADEARFGPDGMVYIGSQQRRLEDANTVGGAIDHPYAAVNTITSFFADRGHSPESIAAFNQDAYLSLPVRLQKSITEDVLSGATPEEINSVMNETLFGMAVMGGYIIPSSTAPTMEEAGLERRREVGAWLPGVSSTITVFDSDEWRQLPIEEKVAQVSATREWEQRVADIANENFVSETPRLPDDMPDSEIADIATEFGLFSSREAQPGERVDRTRPGPAMVWEPDLEATREALNATIERMHQRGAAAIISSAENQRALQRLDEEYQGLLAQDAGAGAQGAPGGSTRASTSVNVTGRATATGGGTPGGAVVTPLSRDSGGAASGYSPQERIPGPVESMELGPQGIANLKGHEGLRLEAYWDENGWAIGYGHRAGVKEGDTITQEQAEELFRQDIQWVSSSIKDNITVPLSQAQFDALASLVYNVGPGGWLSVAEHINNGDMEAAEASWLSHNKARQGEGGPLVVLPGLTSRRRAEWAQFASGVTANYRPVSGPGATAQVADARPIPTSGIRAEVPDARPVDPPDVRARVGTMRTGGTMAGPRTGGRF